MTAVPILICLVLPGHRAQERPDARQQAVAREAMLTQPGLVQPGLVGEPDLIQGIVQRLRRREVLVIGNDGENSELHGGPPWFA